MKSRVLLLLSALLFSTWTLPSEAAKTVQPDVVIHLSKVQPTHRLVQKERVVVPYGPGTHDLGFLPPAPERQAIGPVAFDVDPQGALIVADPVKQRIVRVHPGSTPLLSSVGALPLPFTDLTVDRDGLVYVADPKTRSLWTVRPNSASRLSIPSTARGMGFLRYGSEVVLHSDGMRSLVQKGALVTWSGRTHVEKSNAEAGLLVLGPDAKQILIETGGPLASIQLVGVNAAGDAFLLTEQFRIRGKLDVDRRILVLTASGTLKATFDVVGQPVIHPVREFVLAANGHLYRMVPGDRSVTFLRWEVQP